MKKRNWQIIEGIIILLFIVGIAITASSAFTVQKSVTDLKLYDHYSISSERKIGKYHKLNWLFTFQTNPLFVGPKPQITMLILTQDNYHLLLANDSSANITYERVFNRNYGNGEFIIPSRDIWVIVYNNTNYSEGDTYADYSLTTETNFYNLSLVMSLIVIFGVGILLSVIIPVVVNASSRKQTKLDEDKQQQDEEARGITLNTSEL